LADLRKDVDAIPVPHRDGGHAHEGFQRGLAEVSDEVLKHLDDVRRTHPDLRVLLGGHSLGAAMATLAALDLNREGFLVAGVHTFGSPRVVDPELREVYRQRGLDAVTYRFRKGWDAVVELPPPLGYCHVGTEIYFTSAGGMLVRPSAAAIHADQFLAMQSAFSKLRVLREPEILWDHGPGGYVKHIYVNRDAPLSPQRSA
jgi:pimeloyl-ACP methyl ester carboxylesterase